MLNRLVVAFLLSAAVVALALWRGSLSRSGAIGAMIVGTLVTGLGGWAWGVLLGAFFASSSLLSHYKEAEKQATAEKFEKGNRRDVGQVMANGGLGAMAATMSAIAPSPFWLPLFIGAMATVTADTWATELGTLSRRPPRLITNGHLVEVGTSGGVSLLGTAVSLLGGLLIGLAAGLLVGHFTVVEAALVGMASGLVGSLFDSLLGATVQQIYYCDSCQKETERRIHRCGHRTRPLRGWSWLNNDLVNLMASLVGGATAVSLYHTFIMQPSVAHPTSFILHHATFGCPSFILIYVGVHMISEKAPAGFQLRHTLKANNRAITRLAWSPDGRTLASASYDQTVRLWDTVSGTEIRELYGYSGSVFTVAITPDGRYAISASKNSLKVWDLTGETRSRTLRGHSDYIYAVAITSDGRHAVSGAYDEKLKVWDLATDSERLTLSGHAGRISSVIVTPDNRTIISGAADGKIKLWNLAGGSEEATLLGHKGEILSLALAAEGRLLASASHDCDIRLWDIATREVIHTLTVHNKPVTAVSFAGDTRFLASKSADSTVRLWRRSVPEVTAAWETVATLAEPHSTFAFAGLAFHPQHSVLATLGDKDRVIRIWDLDFTTWVS